MTVNKAQVVFPARAIIDVDEEGNPIAFGFLVERNKTPLYVGPHALNEGPISELMLQELVSRLRNLQPEDFPEALGPWFS